MLANLVLLRMNDLDIILGMDWLSKCRAVLDCFNKVVCFNLEVVLPTLVLWGRGNPSGLIISAINDGKLLRNGCCGFLAFIAEDQPKLNLDDIGVFQSVMFNIVSHLLLLCMVASNIGL